MKCRLEFWADFAMGATAGLAFMTALIFAHGAFAAKLPRGTCLGMLFGRIE